MRKFCLDDKSVQEDFLDETVPVYRAADCLCPAAGGAGDAGNGSHPQDGHQRADVLSLEEEVRGADALGSPQA